MTLTSLTHEKPRNLISNVWICFIEGAVFITSIKGERATRILDTFHAEVPIKTANWGMWNHCPYPYTTSESFIVQELGRSHNITYKAHPFDFSTDIFLNTLQKDPDTIKFKVREGFQYS